MINEDQQVQLDAGVATLMLSVLVSDNELMAFFGSSRYSALFLMQALLVCEQRPGLSKEECLHIGSDLRSRTHRQNFIDEAIKQGFFAKEKSATDARQVVVYPTAKTKRLFNDLSAASRDKVRAVFAAE